MVVVVVVVVVVGLEWNDMIFVFHVKVPASMQKQTPKIQRLHTLVPMGTLLLQTFCFSTVQNWYVYHCLTAKRNYLNVCPFI